MPRQSSTSAKRTTNKKRTNNTKKKSTKASYKKPKKPVKSEQKRQEEITGIIVCAIGMFVLICMFSSSMTGIIGPAVRGALVGTLGSFGYLLPFAIIILGFSLIIKKSSGVKWGQVVIWFFFTLCIMNLYHMMFLRGIFQVSTINEVNFEEYTYLKFVVNSFDFAQSINLSAGGLGAMISYWLIKNVGVVGSVIIALTYIASVVIIKMRISLQKVSHDAKEKFTESIEERKVRRTEFKEKVQTRKKLAILKEKDEDLYVEDLRSSSNGKNKKTILNTDFLNMKDEKLGARGNHTSYSSNHYQVSEEMWNNALDQAQENDEENFATTEEVIGEEKPLAITSAPTITINAEDEDDYKEKKLPKKTINKSSNNKYIYPSLELLELSNNIADANLRQECHANAIRLEETLRHFKVEAKVINITCGPTVTRYELRPAPGVRVSKIDNLSKDIAMALAARSIRIEAPIPNKSAVGIEIPNRHRAMVRLRDILEGSKFRNAISPISICVGKDITGKNIVADLSKMPHMLVAGATGSGKSVFINSLILSLLYKSSPDDVRLIMVDPKKVELNVYNGIPHLLIPVVTKPSMAASALNWAVKEMTDRYDLFASHLVRNLDGFNELAERDDNELQKLPRIVIIIDELADLMQVAAAEVEDAIYRLAQLARAAGMHLVIATQRPDVKVITGTIKANIPCRVAFSVNQFVDSKTILDCAGAEHLLGNGDMLFKAGGGKAIRLQGAFVADKEVENICKSLFVKGAEYDEEVIENVVKLEKQVINGSGNGLGDEFDNLVGEATKIIYDNEKASTSMIQRKLRVGYNRAARLMDDLEGLGIVGPQDGSKPREILVTQGRAMEILNGGK